MPELRGRIMVLQHQGQWYIPPGPRLGHGQLPVELVTLVMDGELERVAASNPGPRTSMSEAIYL